MPERDTVVEQLLEELIARSWALQTLDTAGVTIFDDMSIARELHDVATHLVDAIIDGTRDRHDVVRLLHPTMPPGTRDRWWTTPLGQFLQPAECADSDVAQLDWARVRRDTCTRSTRQPVDRPA